VNNAAFPFHENRGLGDPGRFWISTILATRLTLFAMGGFYLYSVSHAKFLLFSASLFTYVRVMFVKDSCRSVV
jgi:hypothetical protein